MLRRLRGTLLARRLAPDVDDALALAIAYRNRGQFDVADALTRRVPRGHPSYRDALLESATNAFERGDWQEAVKRWKQVLITCPEHAMMAHTKLVKACQQLHDRPRASYHREQIAAHLRPFPVHEALTACQVQAGQSFEVGPSKFSTRFLSGGARSNYVCIHTIEPSSATRVRQVLEKCVPNTHHVQRYRSAYPSFAAQLPYAPPLLHMRTEGKHAYLFFEAVGGSGLDRKQFLAPYYNIPSSQHERVLELAAEVNNVTVDPKLLDEDDLRSLVEPFRRVKPRLEACHEIYQEQLPRHFHGPVLDRARQVVDRYYQSLGQIQDVYEQLPEVLCHYDLATNNILTSTEGEQLYLIDWDNWVVGPPGVDLHYLCYMLARCTEANPLEQTVTSQHRQVFEDIVRRYRERLRWPVSQEQVLLACYQSWIIKKGSHPRRLTRGPHLLALLSAMHELVERAG